MRKILNVIIVFMIIIAIGVVTYRYWDDQNLGNGYYFLPEYEAVDIGYPNGAIIYQSFKKNVFDDIKIYADVIKAKSNKKFIIAIQRPALRDLQSRSHIGRFQISW